MNYGVKLFVTLSALFTLVYVFQESAEGEADASKGFTVGNKTKEVSFPEYLPLYFGNIQVQPKKNEDLSDHRIEGGPSITESLDLLGIDNADDHDKAIGVTSEYAKSTGNLPPDREKRNVDVVCINPTKTRVDECIENMNKQVAEKCLPGINNVFNYMNEANDAERPKGAYSIKTNHSEVCMRDVFSGCTYDSRYRIKTRIRKLIGVNLDLAFQDEFEMDQCDAQTMEDVIEDARECFREIAGGSDIENKVKGKANISTEILGVVGACIDDHTAFSCILQDTELFKKTMRQLVKMLQLQSTQILERMGAEEYKYTRLCVKLMDFDRLENCEPIFFDYILCLMNGTTQEELFNKVKQCFQNSLKVCPRDTVKLFIEILAGAVEGKSGKEPEFISNIQDEEFKIYVPTATNKCSKESIRRWSRSLENCIKPSLSEVFESENVLQSLSEAVISCTRKTKPQECRYHKASEFMMVLDELHGVLNQIPEQAPSHSSFEQPVVPVPPKCKVVCEDEEQGLPERFPPPRRPKPGYGRPRQPKRPKLPPPPEEWGPGAPEEPERWGGGPGLPEDDSEYIPEEPEEDESEYFPEPPEERFPEQPDIKVNWKNCLQQASSQRVKKCFYLLFYYYVSVHHSHHTTQSRQKQLDKAKLCFQVSLKSCPFDFIQRLFRIFGVLLNHNFPKIDKSGIITKVTIPEGYVWCETKIYTDEMPIPTSREIYFPGGGSYTQRETPTTVVPTEYYIPRRTFRRTFPAPRVFTFTVTKEPRIYTTRFTPTTTRRVTWPYKRTTRKEFSPDIETEIIHYIPKTRPEWEERITPTTIYFEEQTPRPRPWTFTFPTVRPKTFSFTPVGRYWTKHIAPTTTSTFTFTIPTRFTTYSRRVPTTTSYTRIPVTRHWTRHRKQTTTRSYTFTLTTRRWSERETFTTSSWTRRPKTLSYSHHRHPSTTRIHHRATPRYVAPEPPKIKIVLLQPKPREYTRRVTRTTAPTRQYPVTKVYDIVCYVGATVGFKVIEFPRRTVQKQVKFTTKAYEFRPKPKIMIKVIRPTTISYEHRTVKVHEDRRKAPAPTPRVIYFTIDFKERTQHRRPTEVLPWDRPQKGWTINITQPPERTSEFTYPRRPKIIFETRTEKPGRFEVFTVPTVTDSGKGSRTTMKVVICEVIRRTKISGKTTPMSRYFGFTPKGRQYTQSRFQTAMRVHIVEVKPKMFTDSAKPYVPKSGTVKPMRRQYADHFQRYPPSKESYTFKPWKIDYERERGTTRIDQFRPHRPIIYEFTFKPFQPQPYELPKKPRIYEFEVPVPQPQEIFFEPDRHEYEQFRPGTTEQPRRHTFPGWEDYGKKTGTTILFEIQEPEGGFPEDQYDAIEPKSIIIRPKQQGRYTKRRRTTIRPYHMRQQPRREHKTRPRPHTEMYEFEPEDHDIQEYVTPTRVDEFYFPIGGAWTDSYPDVTTSTFTFRPETRRYTFTRRPTTTKTYYFTIPKRPWTQSMTQPTTKRRVWEHRPQTKTYVFTVSTQSTRYPVPSRSYTCIYPTIKPPTKCRTVIRKKQCDPLKVKTWQNRIKSCVKQELSQEGKKITDYFDKRDIEELEDYVLKCIKKLGDIPCRNSNFRVIEWVLEKVVSVSGKYGEHAEHVGDAGYNKMKECIIQAKENEVERCLPGLYDILTKVIVYGSPDVEFVFPKFKNSACVIKRLEDLPSCTAHTRFLIEKLMYETLGECYKYTRHPQEMGACTEKPTSESFMRGSGPGSRPGTRKCSSVEIFEFQNDLEYCLTAMIEKIKSSGASKPNVDVLAESAADCIKYNSPPNCLHNDGNQASNIVQFVTRFLSQQNRAQDDCNRALVSQHLQKCMEMFSDMLPRLEEVSDQGGLMQPIVNCIESALAPCKKGVANKIIASLFKLSIPRHIQVPFSSNSDLYSSINSIYVNEEGVDVCEHFFRTQEPPISPVRSNMPDDCVGLKANGQNAENDYVLIKTCSGFKVNSWLNKLSSCVEEKATKVGLNNPDYLTIDRVATLAEECIDQKTKPLKCRAKHQEDFQSIVKTIFQLLKHNALSFEADQCKTHLSAKKVSRCQKQMHNFAAFLSDASKIEASRDKVMECWKSTLKGCRPDILEDVLDVFYIGLIQDESMIDKYYNEEEAPDCTPKGGKFKKPKSSFLSFMHCGNGGILQRKKREEPIPLYTPSSDIVGMKRKIPNFQVPSEKKMYEVCVREDFTSYFGKLKECGKTRLSLKFRRPKHVCRANDMREYWTAMIECMIEDVGSELTCSILTEDQMIEFLEEIEAVLHVVEQSVNSSCEVEPRCYGSDSPALHTCSREFLLLLEARVSEIPLFSILKATATVLDCLREVMPDCSSDIPFLSLSFLFMPLGLNYDMSIIKGLEFANCSVHGSISNISYPDCIGKGSDNEIVPEYSYNSLEVCGKCVEKKSGICQLNNVTDILQCAEADLKRISLCLKSFEISDDCLSEGTTRIKNNCFGHFYRFFKSVRKGIVITSIEYFWKFNECLLNFKTDCSDSYEHFISEVYYSMLGWHPIFKSLLPVFYDTGTIY